MTDLEKAMVEFCRQIAILGSSQSDVPDVEFFYDNGMTASFQITKVPTIKVMAWGLNVTADHEGVRTPK